MEKKQEYVWLVWDETTRLIKGAFLKKENAEKAIVIALGRPKLIRALLHDQTIEKINEEVK